MYRLKLKNQSNDDDETNEQNSGQKKILKKKTEYLHEAIFPKYYKNLKKEIELEKYFNGLVQNFYEKIIYNS